MSFFCVGYHLILFLINLLWALSPFQFPPLFFGSPFLYPKEFTFLQLVLDALHLLQA